MVERGHAEQQLRIERRRIAMRDTNPDVRPRREMAVIADVSISVETSMPKNRASGYSLAASTRFRPVPQPISSTLAPASGCRSAINWSRPSK